MATKRLYVMRRFSLKHNLLLNQKILQYKTNALESRVKK